MPIIFLFEEWPLSAREYSSIFHTVIKAPHAVPADIFLGALPRDVSFIPRKV